jgi:hypothetical protein
VFWLVIGLVSVAVLLIGIRFWIGTGSGEITRYYGSMELTNKNIPIWDPTNSIPLSPDKAVIAAIESANVGRLQPLSWDVDGVELHRYSPDTSWFYIVTLVDRRSGQYELQTVRVLMNGKVWMPERVEKR